MHVCMMHISMIMILCMNVINILDPDACVYDLQCMMHISIHISMILDPVACMNVWSLTLMFVCMMHTLLILIQVAMMHICMMHLSMMLDPDTCMYDAYIYVPRSLILIHACMMHIAMILALDPEACMYICCIYDPGPWSWMYDACNNASFPWFVYIWCFLIHAQMYDAQCTNLWFCSTILMMHESGEVYVYMMRYFLGTNQRTNERTRRF